MGYLLDLSAVLALGFEVGIPCFRSIFLVFIRV